MANFDNLGRFQQEDRQRKLLEQFQPPDIRAMLAIGPSPEPDRNLPFSPGVGLQEASFGGLAPQIGIPEASSVRFPNVSPQEGPAGLGALLDRRESDEAARAESSALTKKALEQLRDLEVPETIGRKRVPQKDLGIGLGIGALALLLGADGGVVQGAFSQYFAGQQAVLDEEVEEANARLFQKYDADLRRLEATVRLGTFESGELDRNIARNDKFVKSVQDRIDDMADSRREFMNKIRQTVATRLDDKKMGVAGLNAYAQIAADNGLDIFSTADGSLSGMIEQAEANDRAMTKSERLADEAAVRKVQEESNGLILDKLEIDAKITDAAVKASRAAGEQSMFDDEVAASAADLRHREHIADTDKSKFASAMKDAAQDRLRTAQLMRKTALEIEKLLAQPDVSDAELEKTIKESVESVVKWSNKVKQLARLSDRLEEQGNSLSDADVKSIESNSASIEIAVAEMQKLLDRVSDPATKKRIQGFMVKRGLLDITVADKAFIDQQAGG